MIPRVHTDIFTFAITISAISLADTIGVSANYGPVPAHATLGSRVYPCSDNRHDCEQPHLNDISKASNIVMTYELVTVLLIVGAGLAGTSEVTKNRLVGYPGFVVGGVGITILLLSYLQV